MQKDCTYKHDYHGKAVYALHNVIRGKQRAATQSVFMFSMNCENRSGTQTTDDLFEIRVYRIEHRVRVWDPTLDELTQKEIASNIKIVDNGLIEQQRPAKMYKYQLLDPLDRPYATVKFYCRTTQWFAEQPMILVDQSSPASRYTSSEYCSPAKSARGGNSATTRMSMEDLTASIRSRESNAKAFATSLYHHRRTQSPESLSTIAKDSLESLLATLRSDTSAVSPCSTDANEQIMSDSQWGSDMIRPSSPPSPCRLYQHQKGHDTTCLVPSVSPSTRLLNTASPLLPPLNLPPLDLSLIARRARSDIQNGRKHRENAAKDSCLTLTSPKEHLGALETTQPSSTAVVLTPTSTSNSHAIFHSTVPQLLRPLSPFTSAGLLRHLRRSPTSKPQFSRPLTPMILPSLIHDDETVGPSTPLSGTRTKRMPPPLSLSNSMPRPLSSRAATPVPVHIPDLHSCTSTATEAKTPVWKRNLDVDGHERELKHKHKQRRSRTLKSLLSKHN